MPVRNNDKSSHLGNNGHVQEVKAGLSDSWTTEIVLRSCFATAIVLIIIINIHGHKPKSVKFFVGYVALVFLGNNKLYFLETHTVNFLLLF